MSHSIRYPAEWEPQAAVLLTWPQPQGAFADNFNDVENVFCDIASIISQYQTVIIGVSDIQQAETLKATLSQFEANLERIAFYPTPSNDVWARDHGPITVYRDGQAILLDFEFNGWGNKYPADKDNAITQQLLASKILNGFGYQSLHWVLEGGALESDGQGTLLTTTQCLLNENRNANWSQDTLSQKLKETLGLKHILWLDGGHIPGDDTDGHIDTLARFLNPDTIAYVPCSDTMESQLQAFTTPSGKPYNLIPLPVPKPVVTETGDPLPATYANFLITNKVVLMPTYGDPYDSVAIHAIKPHFPNHRVIGVNCLPIIAQYGSLHCLTMQIPMLNEANNAEK